MMSLRVMNLIALFCVFLIAQAGSVFAISVNDDTGNTIKLDRPAMRVVTLAPYLTELIYTIGAQDTLVGTVAYSNFPEQAKLIPRIGNYENVSIEKLVALQPDLVLAWKDTNNLAQLKKIQQLGIQVYRSSPRELLGIATTLKKLGQLTGHVEQAKTASGVFTAKLSKLKRRYAGQSPVTAFYQVWHKPIYTINGQTMISKVMAVCGLQNVFADLPILAPKISLEAVVKKDPQMIIVSGMATAEPEWLAMWRDWSNMRAVKAGNLFFVHPDLIQRHSTRILEGTEILCQQADQARERLKLKKKDGDTD